MGAVDTPLVNYSSDRANYSSDLLWSLCRPMLHVLWPVRKALFAAGLWRPFTGQWECCRPILQDRHCRLFRNLLRNLFRLHHTPIHPAPLHHIPAFVLPLGTLVQFGRSTLRSPKRLPPMTWTYSP